MKRTKWNRRWRLLLSAILGAILLIGSGEKVLAEGSMFDSPYVVPYTGIDDDGTERNYFAIRQPQPVDTTRDSGYRYHSLMDYVDRSTGRMGAGPSFWIDEDTKIVTGIESKLPGLK